MKTIAVTQLDRIISTLHKLDSDVFIALLERQISLLQKCESIDHWIYMADVSAVDRIPPQVQSQLGITLKTSLQSDPLDEFYLAANSPSHFTNSGLFSPQVLRIVLGMKAPDPYAIDTLVERHRESGFDYSRSQPVDDGIGTFIEVMSFSALDEAWHEALLPDDRENITPYIYRQQQRLNIAASC